ncbi:DBH-like monooxygenase protein 2 homolog [Gouania willdenowi]|nr:DBH-like monooxygenase protein 2 homolog [Gouania willdenowi]
MKGAVWGMNSTMPFKQYLDHDHLFLMEWGFDDLQGDITFTLVVNTTGWIGFGFSPNGGMAGADMIIGGFGPNGSYFTDQHATGNVAPVVDELQSYTLLSMEENEEQTSMTFRRLIQTCDDKDFHITAQPIKIIYAYGTTDEILYHASRRGTKEVNLLNYMTRTAPSNGNYFNAVVENITVPPITTYYHCKTMKLPKLTTKHHIYLMEPIIDNHEVVHHMLLYHCPPVVTETYDHQCYKGDTGDVCFGVVASWAVGGGIYELPENVGIPVGNGENEIYRLEIHYNNPQGRADIIDSSGLRLYYTSELRQHDVGVLNFGMLKMEHMQYNIPPKADQFHSYGVCHTSHFSQIVNPMPDIHVFAVLLHTHLAGRKVRVGHFRDGQQIDFLGVDENYDFEMQQAMNLGTIKTIKPDDSIIIECTYSTTNRSKVTNLGLGTTDEMCLAFLLYYPALPITTCLSHPITQYLTMKSNDNRSEPISNSLSTQTPEYEDIQAYETLLKTIPQVQIIVDDKFNWSTVQIDGIRDLMKTPTVTCEKTNSSIRLGSSWNLVGIIILLLLIVQL